MSDKDIQNWDQRLKQQADRGWDNYFRRRLHLDTARSDELFVAAGEFLYIEQASSESAAASVKLNRNTNTSLDLVRGVRVETVFQSLHISHEAQAGEWLDFVIGINFKYYKPQGSAGGIDAAQAVIELTHANADTNVAAASNICNLAIIKACPKNTDIAWIDFGQAAVQDSCFPQEPGDSVTVNVSNTDQVNANFEVGGEKVWIIRQV